MNGHLRTAEAVEQSIVKVANERAVLTKVALNPGIFGAEIARRCGLGPQTVASIIEGLQRRGLVRPGEVLRGNRGQPARPYFLAKDGAYAIGCELSWQHCVVQLVNIAGEVLGTHRWDYRYPDATTIFSEIASVVRLLCRLLPPEQQSRLLGVALATPAAIGNQIERLGGSSQDARPWFNLDARNCLAAATGLVTRPFRDGIAACWAELAMLAAPRPGNFCYLRMDTAITSGIVVDGRLLEGPNNDAGRLGKMLLVGPAGETSFAAAAVGLYALEKQLAAAGVPPPAGSPLEWDWPALEPFVRDWLESGSRALAIVIANTAAATGIDLAIIDGTMPSAIIKRYIESVEQQLAQLALPPSLTPRVVQGHGSDVAASRGAAQLLLFRHFFSGELEHFGASI